MANTLLIYLRPHSPETVEWLLADPEAPEPRPQVSPLNDIVALAKQHPVQLIIPSQYLTILALNLPPTSRQRLQQAVPYACEEQLIDDITDLHFAIGEKNQQGNWPIHIIKKSLLESCLAPWTDAKVYCQALLADIFMLPRHADGWSVYLDNDTALIRYDDCLGFAISLDQLTMALKQHCLEKNILPEKLYLYSTTTIPTTLLEHLSTISSELEVADSHCSKLTLYTRHCANSPTLNLLQGDYYQKPPRTKRSSLGVPLAILSAIWLILLMLNVSIETLQLRQQDRQLEQQINTLYRKVFPQATSVSQARVKQKLRELAQQTAGNQALSLLAKAGEVIKSTAGVKLSQINYQNNQLNLEVTTNDFSTLEKLVHDLAQTNLTVQQESANQAGNTVIANIKVTEKSP